MFGLLQPQDTIKVVSDDIVAVDTLVFSRRHLSCQCFLHLQFKQVGVCCVMQAIQVECPQVDKKRYLVLVSTAGRGDTEESAILGVDIRCAHCDLGLVMPLWSDTRIRLLGDGQVLPENISIILKIPFVDVD